LLFPIILLIAGFILTFPIITVLVGGSLYKKRTINFVFCMALAGLICDIIAGIITFFDEDPSYWMILGPAISLILAIFVGWSAAKIYPRQPKNKMIFDWGVAVWTPISDQQVANMLNWLKVAAFVRATGAGFEIFTRGSRRQILATVSEGKDKGFAIREMIGQLHLNGFLVSTGDKTTIELLRPFSSSIKPFPNDDRCGELTVIVLN